MYYELYDTLDGRVLRTFTLKQFAAWLHSNRSDWYLSRGYAWREVLV